MRTSLFDVASIIELDDGIVPNDAAMEAFAAPASAVVDYACTGANGPASAYSDEVLELIERWLTAHFYTVRDPRTTNEKAGSVGASFQSAVAIGFDSSHYGQTAMRLDTNGGLAKLNKDSKKGKPKVGGFWAATAYNNND